MSRTAGAGLALVLALAVFLTDQFLKRLVEGSMRTGQSIPLVQDVLYLTYVKNSGGAFGILGGQIAVLLAGSAVAIVFVLWVLLAGLPTLLTVVGCGLVLGGAAGNLLDRIAEGWVTDFLDLQFWPLQRWPVFNVADVAIVLGVAALLLAALRPEKAGR
ncbi:MAG TPA: signal peptidase II [Rubrobacteraceae bacterium]|nr:signal peptidase II [Rubrobacteraceae bacterium]